MKKSKELKVAINAVKSSGKILLEHFRQRHIIKAKSRFELVTNEDIRSEKNIIRLIQKNFPHHNILSEEKGQILHKSEYLWIIDPLDGTTNYIMGNPIFAASIALAHRGEIILGATYAPCTDELFYAEKGKGVYLNGKKIRVSEVKDLKKSLVTYCHGHGLKARMKAIKFYKPLKLNTRDARQLGAASLELGYVAAGRTECIVIPGIPPWDAAAGSLFVKEAGGKTTDFGNRPWSLKSKDILASNAKIHNKILRLIR